MVCRILRRSKDGSSYPPTASRMGAHHEPVSSALRMHPLRVLDGVTGVRRTIWDLPECRRPPSKVGMVKVPKSNVFECCEDHGAAIGRYCPLGRNESAR